MRTVPLKRLTSEPVKNGLGLSGAEANLDDPRYIRITDIDARGRLRPDIYASQPSAVIGDAWVVPDDILIASVGATVGKSYLHKAVGEFCFAGYLSRVRIDHQKADARYIYYWTQSLPYWSQVRQRSVLSTIENLSASKIASFEVPFISRLDQREVADYLDHETAEIDAFIGEQVDLRALVNEKNAARRELLIGLLDVKHIPLRRLKPQRTTGTSVNGSPWPAGEGEVGVLKTGAVSRGYFAPSDNKTVVESKDVERLTSPVVGDRVLVNRANTPSLVGTVVYVAESIPNLFLSDKLWSIDFDASNEYMVEAMSTRLYRDQVALSSVGASSSMHNLSYEDFLSVRIPVPSRPRQASIVEELRQERRAARAALDSIEQAVSLAKERRAALITAAVTGQIDVTDPRRGPSAAEQLEDEMATAR